MRHIHSFSPFWFIAPCLALNACEGTGNGDGVPTQTSSDVTTTGTVSPGNISVAPTSPSATNVSPTSSAAPGVSTGGVSSSPTTTSAPTTSATTANSASTNDSPSSSDAASSQNDTGTSETGSSETLGESSAATITSGGETDEPGGWSPCQENPCKVLPLGDSITFGLGYDGGYRVELFRLAHSNQLGLTFVGSEANGPQMVDGAPFPQSHEGFSGWTIQQIYNRLFSTMTPSVAMAQEPEIVLLHIGANDMYQGPEGASERLGTLIDDLTESLPDSLIVVSTIIPFPQSAATVSAYNADLVTVVNARIDAGKHVAFVDQFEGFPTGELGDGVHPNQQGYNRMGAKWYQAISEYLPAAQ